MLIKNNRKDYLATPKDKHIQSRPGSVRKANFKQNLSVSSLKKRQYLVIDNRKQKLTAKILQDNNFQEKNASNMITTSRKYSISNHNKLSNPIKNQKHLIQQNTNNYQENIKIFEDSFQESYSIPWKGSPLSEYLYQNLDINTQKARQVNKIKNQNRNTPSFTMFNTERLDRKHQEINIDTRQCIQNVQNIQQTIKNILKR